MTEPLLALTGVHTHIGLYHILHGIDIEVPRGEVVLLLGRNGAGKTTTLRTIMGLWRASSGKVAFAASDITHEATSSISQRGIAYVPENMAIFPDLLVRENILLAARGVRQVRDLPEDRLNWIFELFPPIQKFWNSAAGTLSGGQKQMLALARAIIEPRELLLIDEPSKGLAPAIVDRMTDALLQLKAAGATILLVEQNLEVANAVGDRVTIMDDGRIVHTGRMGEWRDAGDLQEKHLGLTL